MTIEEFNRIYLIIQALIWAAMLVTAGITFLQFKVMQRAATGQNILALVNFLQQPHIQEARTTVRRI